MARQKNLSLAALVVAVLALVASLGGGTYAANLLTGKDIKNGSITGKDVKKASLKGKHVKDKSLTGKDVKDGSLAASDLAAGTLEEPIKTVRVAATSGATFDAARSAAPEQVLFTDGALTVYGKCYTDASGPSTYASAYVRTTVSGSILASGNNTLSGGDPSDYLNTDTSEDDREIESRSTGTNGTNFWRSITSAHAPDGSTLTGTISVGAKNGTLAGGNGPYGAGDACVFVSDFRSN